MANQFPVPPTSAETLAIATANGQTVFSYDFLIFKPEQMRVIIRPNSGGQEVELHYPNDFSITGVNNNNGGEINLIGVQVFVNDEIYMWRDTIIEREKSWQNEGDYKAELVNAEQNEIFMIMQENRRDVNKNKFSLNLERTERIAADDKERTERINNDKAIASLIGQAGPIEVPMYDTRFAVTFAKIKPTISTIRTGGYDAPGDGGDFLWVDEDTGAASWDLRNEVKDFNGKPWWLRKTDFENIRQRGLYELGTVIWFGSSTFAGQGTSGYVEQPSVENGWSSSSTSFPAMVAEKYGSRARVINCSVGGSNTLSLILEFFKKVEPQSPRFVILGSGWVNEVNLAGGNIRIATANYISRIKRLAGLCIKYGAKPIVAAFTPINGYSIEFVTAQLDIMRAIDMMGIPRWDMIGIAGTGDLAFKAGRAADNVHGNDVAHQAYFDSARWSDIEIGAFPLWIEKSGAGAPGRLIVSPSEDTVTEPPLATVFDTVSSSGQVDFPKSLTVMAKIKPPSTLPSDLRNLISIHRGTGYQNEPLRVRLGYSNQYQLVRNDGTGTIVMHTSDIPVGDVERTHTLVYDHSSNRVRWYIEGTEQVSVENVPMDSDIYAVTILGDATNAPRARGFSVSEYKLWKTVLPGLRFISPILRGEINAGSMLFDMDFTVENQFAAVSRIQTLTRTTIGANVEFSR